MQADALDALRALRLRLGRDPSFVELLQELGHAPAGTPSAPPGQVAHPSLPSALLGSVESDEGLTALLRCREMREAHPDLERLRQHLVHQLLYGDLPPVGPGGAGQRPPQSAQALSGMSAGYTLPGPGGMLGLP